MSKQIFFLLAVAAVSLSLSGCHYERGYRSGHASGQYQYGWYDGYRASRGRGLEDKVRELEEINAALRAANEDMRIQSKIDRRDSNGVPIR